MSDELRFWVVKNDYGFICKVCKQRGVRVAHEFYSLNCVPLVFSSPEEWQLIERRQVEDLAGHGLDILGHRLGTLIEVTAAEAQALCRAPGRPRLESWDYLAALGLR